MHTLGWHGSVSHIHGHTFHPSILYSWCDVCRNLRLFQPSFHYTFRHEYPTAIALGVGHSNEYLHLCIHFVARYWADFVSLGAARSSKNVLLHRDYHFWDYDSPCDRRHDLLSICKWIVSPSIHKSTRRFWLGIATRHSLFIFGPRRYHYALRLLGSNCNETYRLFEEL